MRARNEERDRYRTYGWLKRTGHLPCLEKPRGEIPQHAINHFRMPVYGLERKNEPDSEKG
jgi:hypothetical protein